MNLRRWWCGKVGHRKPVATEPLGGTSDLALGDCARCGTRLMILCGAFSCEWTDRMHARHMAVLGLLRSHQEVLAQMQASQMSAHRDSHLLN